MSDAPNPRLDELATAIHALMEEIEDQGGEISDAQVAYLNRLEGTREAKVDVICKLFRKDLDDAVANRAEAKRQIAKAVARENRAERRKKYLGMVLKLSGETRIETTFNVVRIQPNSQPSVRWTGEPSTLPPAFRREIPAMFEPDKKAAAAAWKKKQPLPAGFEVTLGEHVVIA